MEPVSKIVWLHSLSSIHVGAGDSVDVIDLPVAREKVTNWPYIPGSALKGVFRDVCTDFGDGMLVKDAFGPDTKGSELDSPVDGAGQLWFADARLLCFPVRSLHGTFAWLTCPYALMRLSRDLAATGGSSLPKVEGPAKDEDILLSSQNSIADGESVYLEDLDLNVKTNPSVETLASFLASQLMEESWRSEFTSRFGLVSDNIFTFLVETCTEVAAHIRIKDDTKTVQDGALWYEESVPPETIFSFPLTASSRKNGRSSSDLLGLIRDAIKKPVQIGGKASVGRGLLRAAIDGKE
jgi:CRISPR-associated protein Cmr4